MTTETAASEATTVESQTTLLSVESDSVVESNVNQNSDSEYGYVPEKFMGEEGPDIESLAKSYTELEKKIRTTRPSAPKSAEEYQFETALQLDSDLSNAFKSEALDQGISTDQFKWIMSKYESEINAISMTPEKAEQALKQDWGNDYDTNIALANKAFSAYVDKELAEQVGNNPAVIKVLAKIGAELNEDRASSRDTGIGSGYSQTEIEEIMSSKDYFQNKEKQKLVDAWFFRNG